MKYLVMECRPGYAIVLGDDGTFLKVANIHYAVGQTVTDVVPLKLPESFAQPKTNHRRWISSLAAMAACMALVVSSIFFTGQLPYASVYMTINPEVRIDVNRRDTVVGVEGMNDDGAELLKGYDHRKKELDTVMDELVDRAIDMGYLHEGGKITLSLDGNDTWIANHGIHLDQHLNQHLTDKITVTIDIQQKQPVQAAPTIPAGTIVIPVGPDHYGDSDYGVEEESDYGQSDYDDSGLGDSGYEDSIYGDSVYEEPEDDGQTDYDDWSEDSSESEYEDQSDYDTPQDDAQSDYISPDSTDAGADNGDSGYEQTDYETSDENASDYEDADSDYNN